MQPTITPEQIERAESLAQDDQVVRLLVDMLFFAEDRSLPS